MKFEVSQRQQLASERAPLTLFAPAPSTISFVPLTRNLSLADPSSYPVRGWTGLSEATATRFPVLRTTKCDAFSERAVPKTGFYGTEYAFGAQNSLLWYAMRFLRHSATKRAPGVRDAFSKARRTAAATSNASSKARITADSTDCGQPPAAADASSVRDTASARR